MGASASPTDRTGWAVIAPKVQPSRQRKTRRKTLWKRRTVEKSEERLFPRAWKSRQVRGIPTFPQRPRRLDDEESQKPKPDISLATKSGHFNLLRTQRSFPVGQILCKSATIGAGRTRRAAMATTHKKVIVRKMDRDSVNGYVSASFVSEGKLELLNTAGNVVSIELREVKGVYFVREFGDSESLTRKTFTSRPRIEGLWVRLRFRDNEV